MYVDQEKSPLMCFIAVYRSNSPAKSMEERVKNLLKFNGVVISGLTHFQSNHCYIDRLGQGICHGPGHATILKMYNCFLAVFLIQATKPLQNVAALQCCALHVCHVHLSLLICTTAPRAFCVTSYITLPTTSLLPTGSKSALLINIQAILQPMTAAIQKAFRSTLQVLRLA